MPSIIVRNLSDQVHRALRLRAAANGRSAAAEVRDILTTAALPQDRLLIGTELRKFAATFGGVELDIRRDSAPIEPAQFE